MGLSRQSYQWHFSGVSLGSLKTGARGRHRVTERLSVRLRVTKVWKLLCILRAAQAPTEGRLSTTS